MNQKKNRPVPISFIVNRDLDTTAAFDSLHDSPPIFVDERSLGQPAGGCNDGFEGAPRPAISCHLFDQKILVKPPSQSDHLIGQQQPNPAALTISSQQRVSQTLPACQRADGNLINNCAGH
jgi:hypothetical protein